MVAEGLVRRDHHVTLCAPETTLQRLRLTDGGGDGRLRLVALPLGRPSAVRWLRRVRRLASEHDVIHAQGVRVGAQLALARVTPLVVTWHNAPLGSSARHLLHSGLERVSARWSAVVLGASPDLVERARAAGSPNAHLLTVAAPPQPAVEVAHRELEHPPTVLAVARLHRQKRLDLLIEVASRWPATPDRPRFVIAGDGPLLDKLQASARDADAPVAFLGARDDVAELLARADVVVLPSDWEARPLVAQEALRAGVPLVATDVGGVRDLVGTAAVLVPPGDSKALARGIRSVLADADLRMRLQRAGPARAAEWPTADEMIEQLLHLYVSLREGGQSG